MSTSKKYQYQIEQNDSTWTAQITRKISSKKTISSKQQDGFANEVDAKKWAEQEISEFSKTQNANNQRHGTARQLNQKVREDRSNRRADKTARAKATKDADSEQSNPEN